MVIFDTPGFLVVPFTMFLAGLPWALYSRLFIGDLPQEQSEAHIAGLADNMLLLGGFPVSGMNWPAGKVNTAQNAQPPSVTEG
jgi:hypothetical protein